jgi:putative flippase GtrA
VATDTEAAPEQGAGSLRRLRRSHFAIKLTRYAIGSVVALPTIGVGTTLDSILAFVAGAGPNWVLNRRWAWQRTGKMDVRREVIGYTAISLVALAASSAGTGWVDTLVRHHYAHQHVLRVTLVTLTYVVVQALLFGAKFIAYDLWVFAEKLRRDDGSRPV